MVQIFENLDAISHYLATEFARLAQQSIAERGVFMACLAGGKTPQRFYDRLALDPFRKEILWTQVHLFWGDERCVPPDHPESNYYQVFKSLAPKVDIPIENLHRVKGELDPALAVEAYRAELEKWAAPGLKYPAFDFVLLGMGEDGHTASLFPGSEPDPVEPLVAVTASYQGRPANRLTLTPRVFNAARSIYVMVVGSGKAPMVARVLKGDKDLLNLPVQRIQPFSCEPVWLIDREAARLIPSG